VLAIERGHPRVLAGAASAPEGEQLDKLQPCGHSSDLLEQVHLGAVVPEEHLVHALEQLATRKGEQSEQTQGEANKR
jgi:hypothetical protein